MLYPKTNRQLVVCPAAVPVNETCTYNVVLLVPHIYHIQNNEKY